MRRSHAGPVTTWGPGEELELPPVRTVQQARLEQLAGQAGPARMEVGLASMTPGEATAEAMPQDGFRGLAVNS